MNIKTRHQGLFRLMTRFLRFSVIRICSIFLLLRSREPSTEVMSDSDPLLRRRALGRSRAIVWAGYSGHTCFAGEEQPFRTDSSLKSTQRILPNSKYRKYGAPIRDTTIPVGKAVSITVRPIASAINRMMLPISSAIQL